MPKRNHLGAERVVRPEVPRVRAAIDTTAISSVFMSMVFFLFAIMMPTWQGLDVGLPRIMPGSLEIAAAARSAR